MESNCNSMKNIIKVLDKLFTEKTKNPYIRFIIKRNVKEEKIKAFKTYRIELYLHSPDKNVKIITTQELINTTLFSNESIIWDHIESYFMYEVLKLMLSDNIKELIDEYTME